MEQTSAAYGLWPSPITPAALSQAKRLEDVAWDTDGRTLVWLEGRSDRGVIVCDALRGDAPRDLTSELSVRAWVGYGGGDMTAAHGQVFFVSEGRLYRQPLGQGAPHAITPAFGQAASPVVSPDGRWLVYVHSDEDQDCLAIVDVQAAHWPQRLASGADFYMQPAWHPDGQRIAWIAWDHPQMPWDGTRLELGALEGQGSGLPRLGSRLTIAGDDDTSVLQPEFSPDGRWLAYISDASGWYNLTLYDLVERKTRLLAADEAEWAAPAWRQGMRTYAWSADSARIYGCRNSEGSVRLWSWDVETGRGAPVPSLADYTDVAQVAVSQEGPVALLASSWRTPRQLLTWHPPSGSVHIVARSEGETTPEEVLSEPESITWPSNEGDPVHGLLYMPRTGRFRATGEPPLIVMVHGGPTGQATMAHSVRDQYFASRGYAVLQVNYRGSSGYGRAYRNALRGNWGILDVEDAISGARHLASRGLVDAQKMVIMGGSAGGYTVLRALATALGTFKAGICLYGVTNLFTLAADTHKFEQRYLDSIVGPLPETAERYRERSPIFQADRIRDPAAIFQGEEDQVVPRDQAETIVQALRANRVPHEYHLYPGEGHGWRKAETIEAFHQAVDKFLKQYVLFA